MGYVALTFPHTLVAYGLHLIPFILINGVLTGAWTPAPVVWYHEEAILGLRVATIPLEDFLYALLLFMMLVAGYEFFKPLLSLKARFFNKKQGSLPKT